MAEPDSNFQTIQQRRRKLRRPREKDESALRTPKSDNGHGCGWHDGRHILEDLGSILQSVWRAALSVWRQRVDSSATMDNSRFGIPDTIPPLFWQDLYRLVGATSSERQSWRVWLPVVAHYTHLTQIKYCLKLFSMYVLCSRVFDHCGF